MATLIINEEKIKNKLKSMDQFNKIMKLLNDTGYGYESVGGGQLDIVEALIHYIDNENSRESWILEDRTTEEVAICVINLLLGYTALLTTVKSFEDDIHNKVINTYGGSDDEYYFCGNFYEDVDSEYHPIVCVTAELPSDIYQIWMDIEIDPDMFTKLMSPNKMQGTITGNYIQEEILELPRFKQYVLDEMNNLLNRGSK